ncbi:MAG TPA: TolC family protein [bacterium]|nr:TolC family protein [bacterium]
MKKIYLLILIFILNVIAFSQDNFDEYLHQILKNNPELQSIQHRNKAVIYNSKNKLLPFDPELEYKVKENNNYEVGITQKLKFPPYYFLQYKVHKLTRRQQSLIQDIYVIKILENAMLNINDLIYLQNKIDKQAERLNRARRLNRFFKDKLEQGEISQFPLNKSKLHLLEHRSRLSGLNESKKEVLQNLKKLNGGKNLKTKIGIYQPMDSLSDFKKYKEKYFSRSPEIKLARINSDLSTRNLKIAKLNWLPDISFGIHSDNMKNSNVHFGISLPIWKNRNRVKKAQAELNYKKYSKINIFTEKAAQIKTLYSQFKNKKELYFDYKTTLKSDKTQLLLEESVKSGEISAINYFQEIEKLYKYQDRLLELRHAIANIQTKLKNYKLLEVK